MENIGYNKETGFLFVNTLSIDNATFNKWDTPPISNNSVSPSPGSMVNIFGDCSTELFMSNSIDMFLVACVVARVNVEMGSVIL